MDDQIVDLFSESPEYKTKNLIFQVDARYLASNTLLAVWIQDLLQGIDQEIEANTIKSNASHD